MRWLLLVALSAAPAYGAGLDCRSRVSFACNPDGCSETRLPPVDMVVDYDAGTMTMCPAVGCQEPLSILVSMDRQHFRFIDDDGAWPTTFASWMYDNLIVVDQYAAVVLIDYYDCKER